jgi:type IV secretory pathway TrbF-like protein
MTFADTIKRIVQKAPTDTGDQRRPAERMDGGRRKGEAENPYLAARRTWNDHVGEVKASRQMWQMLGILALLVALTGMGGVIYIGSQSRFVPYVVEVDKLGQAAAVRPAQRAGDPDERVMQALVSQFMADVRQVSPDVALQRKAVFRLYSMLAPTDPATTKTNEYLNGTEDSSPFKRSEKETVSIEVQSALRQTADTWQLDWDETVRDRQGLLKGKPFRMRALVSVYIVPPTPQTTEEQVRNNPVGLFVRDFSWSKQL